MTDTELLQDKIRRSGLKISFIAEVLGLSRSGLWRKVSGKALFNQYEIQALSKLLAIDDLHERERIFFAQNVDKSAHIESNAYRTNRSA